MTVTNFPNGLSSFGVPQLGVLGFPIPRKDGHYWFVDATNGSDGNSGLDIDNATASIGQAITLSKAGDVILIMPKAMAAGAIDPANYAETIIIPAAKSNLALVGIGFGRTQGGLPQIKIGAGSTALLTIRAPGCLIANLGFNGVDSTGGGILLDDDASTKSAFGTSIINCHFKNCVGSAGADTGGGVQWSSNGGAWQTLIKGCSFFRCMGGIVLKGTGVSRPVDVVIEDCIFHTNDTALVDCDIYLMGGSGVAGGLIIRNCTFATRTIPAYAGTSRYLKLTGCAGGLVSGCTFNCLANVTATELTWGVAGSGGFIPAGVGIAGCFGVSTTAGEIGQINNL